MAFEKKKIIFVCTKRKIYNSPPVFLGGIIPSESVLQQIAFK
jgi:hypothetical protein